jgi:hypothetical protein
MSLQTPVDLDKAACYNESVYYDISIDGGSVWKP